MYERGWTNQTSPMCGAVMIIFAKCAAPAQRLRAVLRDRHKKATRRGPWRVNVRRERRTRRRCHWIGVSDGVCGVQQSRVGRPIPPARSSVVGSVPWVPRWRHGSGARAACIIAASHVRSGGGAGDGGNSSQGYVLHRASIALARHHALHGEKRGRQPWGACSTSLCFSPGT